MPYKTGIGTENNGKQDIDAQCDYGMPEGKIDNEIGSFEVETQQVREQKRKENSAVIQGKYHPPVDIVLSE